MENNIYVIEEAIMPTFKYQFTGPLVFTPDAIYFIAAGKVSNVKIGAMAGAGAQFGVLGWTLGDKLVKKEFDKANASAEDMDNYIQELDKLVIEKEGSAKIAKIDIDTFKVPTGMLSNSIKIKSQGKKYEFNIGKQKKKVPELSNYLRNNVYPVD